MRQAERCGIIEAPLELDEIVADLGLTPDAIDTAFELFVSPDGRTIGGTLNLDLLPGEWIGRLVLAGLIEKTKHGEWDLSEQGHAVSLLLDEYSDRKYMWCSLAGSRP